MGQADWAALGSSLAAASLARGVTAGITPPAGIGGSFVFGYNTLDDSVGAHGLYVDLAGFNPTGAALPPPAGGGSVRGCVRRVASPGNTGMSPFLFFCCQGGPPEVADEAYMLGLLDADPYQVVLAKGPIGGGLVEAAENLAILRQSSAQYNMGDNLWHYLRLDAIVEPNGDVLLKAYASPLSNPPVWSAIGGMSDFIDDALRINSGSAPLWGGYCGFAFATAGQINRRGAFDMMEAYRLT